MCSKEGQAEGGGQIKAIKDSFIEKLEPNLAECIAVIWIFSVAQRLIYERLGHQPVGYWELVRLLEIGAHWKEVRSLRAFP